MWSDLTWPAGLRTAKRPSRSITAGIGLVCLAFWLPALHAADSDLPVQCNISTIKGQKAPAEAIEDCVEFGAAVGELGLDWRQKLPAKVRWVTRKDAKTLCTQKTSEWGQRVGSPLAQGCVFLAPKECTILTDSYISHATLGNAVRACSP
ncbi:hypothetical protein B9Z33_11825 [Limnohabitans sp. T6-20]|nr:hypothetical protein B9Z33_11825 [Limnohabitans sp. T6-20]